MFAWWILVNHNCPSTGRILTRPLWVEKRSSIGLNHWTRRTGCFVILNSGKLVGGESVVVSCWMKMTRLQLQVELYRMVSNGIGFMSSELLSNPLNRSRLDIMIGSSWQTSIEVLHKCDTAMTQHDTSENILILSYSIRTTHDARTAKMNIHQENTIKMKSCNFDLGSSFELFATKMLVSRGHGSYPDHRFSD